MYNGEKTRASHGSVGSAGALDGGCPSVLERGRGQIVNRQLRFWCDQFVPQNRRIAVFDNNGTLWSEKPFYFQVLFAMERLAVLTSNVLKAVASI